MTDTKAGISVEAMSNTVSLDTENTALVPTSTFQRDTKDYLLEAACALYLERNPKVTSQPVAALAANGEVLTAAKDGPTVWYTEMQIKEHHLRIATKALDDVMYQLADKVPANIRTHEWFKKAMAAMVDVQAFPALPK